MTDPYFDLTGQVALVTGGSRGLGYQMVRAFAERGADVIIASRKLDNCEAVAEEVRALGRRALAVAGPRRQVGLDRPARSRPPTPSSVASTSSSTTPA